MAKFIDLQSCYLTESSRSTSSKCRLSSYLVFTSLLIVIPFEWQIVSCP